MFVYVCILSCFDGQMGFKVVAKCLAVFSVTTVRRMWIHTFIVQAALAELVVLVCP